MASIRSAQRKDGSTACRVFFRRNGQPRPNHTLVRACYLPL
ncbi:hypothetical protein MMMB2_3920 [Mycobacterium marinum MB2]|nr:hypothetical protein MMMB2_3920 [Mycobacterium marinum MB2]